MWASTTAIPRTMPWRMDGLEYLWQGDPKYYARTSPTLFPIMGRFLSDTYYVKDRPYHMTINGFAMDRNFTAADITDTSAEFVLTDDDHIFGHSFQPFR